MLTDIEQKALALVNEVRRERGHVAGCEIRRDGHIWSEALCRAIEQHEAFRQEVSDACKKWTRANVNCREPHDLDRFIIPKPDPLVEALEAALWDVSNVKLTDGELVRISNTIAASGLEVRKIGEGE